MLAAYHSRRHGSVLEPANSVDQIRPEPGAFNFVTKPAEAGAANSNGG
jgi:hypothetical protein